MISLSCINYRLSFDTFATKTKTLSLGRPGSEGIYYFFQNLFGGSEGTSTLPLFFYFVLFVLIANPRPSPKNNVKHYSRFVKYIVYNKIVYVLSFLSRFVYRQ